MPTIGRTYTFGEGARYSADLDGNVVDKKTGSILNHVPWFGIVIMGRGIRVSRERATSEGYLPCGDIFLDETSAESRVLELLEDGADARYYSDGRAYIVVMK